MIGDGTNDTLIQIDENRLKFISDYFLSKFKLEDYSRINRGYCYYWAYVVNKLFGGKLCTVEENGMHAYVKIGNKYYDAERPRGVRRRKQLPFFIEAEWPSYSRVQSREKFISFWTRNGINGFHPRMIEMIYKIIRNVFLWKNI